MRISFAADLHGRAPQYKQMFENAWRAEADLLLLGGDLFPSGPLPLDPDADIALQRRFGAEVLRPLVDQFRRLSPKTRIFYLPGNHDWAATLPVADGLWEPLHGRRVALDGCELIGFCMTPPCPFPLKDWERLDLPGDPADYAEPALRSTTDGQTHSLCTHEHLMQTPTLSEMLAALPLPEQPGRAICVFHGPPHGTNCDQLLTGEHIGSRAIRDYIERAQPMIALCGHVHDSPYKSSTPYDRIGRTVVCNPGAGELNIHQVTFDLGDPRAGIAHTVFGVEHPFSGGEIPVGPDFVL